MSADNRHKAIVTAGTIATVAIGAYAIRAVCQPYLRARATRLITQMLEEADIFIGRDIHVHDDAIFLDWANRGMLAIGESYMAKKWEAIIPLDEILTRLLKLPVATKRRLFKSWNSKIVGLGARIFNYQSPSRAGIVGAHHYDIGNEFYLLWLDPYMQYSCAYFKGIRDLNDLDAAQEKKMRLIGEKLKLKKGMKILEIGCGWGGLACYLAKTFDVHVTGITISNEQLRGAREWAAREGVAHLTSFEYCDYREMQGQFDRVVSIAMLEAVGYKNMETYYAVIERCLKDDGLALVHSIAANRSLKVPNQLWILKYIFPNGFLPSVAQMLQFTERKLIPEDVHNFGPDYDKTLMCWNKRFQEQVEKGTIDKSEVFIRMWEFYLQYCAAGFRARTIQLVQIVYSKNKAERYDAVR